MVWKLSIDLSRPLVASMGHHDPLDGFVTCTELEATAAALPDAGGPTLAAAVTEFDQMIDRTSLMTADPLGLGGLLFDACRLAQIEPEHDLIPPLMAATRRGLEHWLTEPDLRLRPQGGLSIGDAIALFEDGQRAVADELEHVSARFVHCGDDDFRVVIEQRDNFLRSAIIGDV